MNSLKAIVVPLVISFFSIASYGQVALSVSKPLSQRDKQEVTTILSSFDANSYKIDIKAQRGNLNMGRAKGLASVGQKNTARPALNGKISTTKSTLITNANIFQLMSTNTNNNIFKEGKYTNNQLTKMDKLYSILTKYQ
ncbi:hypothetical protein [Pedobacter sp. L105]|uniref:hypothetical protein n=1 Tax=Pedobacter sp. L105 TaxID=1641871 RepID=UPI00131BDFF3|nr:hypothetical protein [Pedobacter sp. L105]